MSHQPDDPIDYTKLVPPEWSNFPNITSLEELCALDSLRRFRIYRYWRRQYVACCNKISKLTDSPSSEQTDTILSTYQTERDHYKSICHFLFCLDQQCSSHDGPFSTAPTKPPTTPVSQ